MEFKVYFDGGESGPRAYGSWRVDFMGFSLTRSRLHFEPEGGEWLTSNMAEYRSLISALEFLQSVAGKRKYRVSIVGDSMLVVNQVQMRWKVRKPHLLPLRDRCRELLKEFGHWKIEWRPRAENVQRFGH